MVRKGELIYRFEYDEYSPYVVWKIEHNTVFCVSIEGDTYMPQQLCIDKSKMKYKCFRAEDASRAPPPVYTHLLDNISEEDEHKIIKFLNNK